MTDSLPLLAALLALLIGLAAGKAWERYKLKEGRWIDRRKTRESPHFIQGLNLLVTQQLDLAIDELGQAARVDPDAVEIQMILGNLYREKGQVGRAVQVHQQLLQRPRLTRLEHAHALLSLGLDFKRGGFVDRALEAFNEVLRLDPSNAHALLNLEKLHEDQHQWDQAYAVRQRLAALVDDDHQEGHRSILAFLENELGVQALRKEAWDDAERRFQAAIDLDPRTVPAYLNLGDLRLARGDTAGALDVWERVIEVAPERAYLAFDRLAAGYPAAGAPARFHTLCRRLIEATPQDWRARLALANDLAAKGSRDAALELLFEALAFNPHSLKLHGAIWRVLRQLELPGPLVERYVDTSDHAVFYQDPHICLRCRYRSDELLWQCPHCHEWNTFVEDRITPAKEREEQAS